MDLSTFYATAAGSSATLMGLLFVALQFNLEKRGAEQDWRPVARATFNIFTILFITCLFALIRFPAVVYADRLLFFFAPATALYRQVYIWWPTRKRVMADRLFHTLWMVFIPVVVYVLMILFAVVLTGDTSNPLDIEMPEAILIAVLFLTALRNSWDLVLEAGLINRGS